VGALATNGQGATRASAAPLPPLAVAGLVLRRADLVAALRLWVPNLAEIEVSEDGESFFLLLERTKNTTEGNER
jgi:hypothetical protein